MFNKELADAIREKLVEREETIAVAESVTSGMLQAALSMAKDASLFYQGGITAYNLGQKYRHLMVDPIHALSSNCVSAKVAESMAHHVCTLFGSHWGIGVCGYAAPAEESKGKMFAYFAVSFKGKIVSSGKLDSELKEGVDTQLFFTNTILQQLFAWLQKESLAV